MRISVGCCGFPGGKRAYFRQFDVVEVQETFYKLPRTSTVERWRREAPHGFVFAYKSWQVITHPHTSPTWRRAGLKISPRKVAKYGLLKPTKENFSAWEEVLEIGRVLQAKVCVVQCPPSFVFTPKNVRSCRTFFKEISYDSIRIGWEPRGDWHPQKVEIKRICERFDLIHVVDLLRDDPALIGRVLYTRLHGLGGKEVNYKYVYTDRDLKRLREKVLAAKGADEVFVMFNNVSMREDAKRFLSILAK